MALYLWMAGLDVKTAVKGVQSDVNFSLSDIWERLDVDAQESGSVLTPRVPSWTGIYRTPLMSATSQYIMSEEVCTKSAMTCYN